MGEIARITEVEDVSLLLGMAPGTAPLSVLVHLEPWAGMTWDEMAQRLTEQGHTPRGYYAFGTPTDGRSESPDGYYETDESRHLADITDRTQATRIVMAHIVEEVW